MVFEGFGHMSPLGTLKASKKLMVFQGVGHMSPLGTNLAPAWHQNCKDNLKMPQHDTNMP
eukprot:12402852-Karenia_brevis.AAC.1